MTTRECETCGRAIEGTSRRRFCGSACRNRAHRAARSPAVPRHSEGAGPVSAAVDSWLDDLQSRGGISDGDPRVAVLRVLAGEVDRDPASAGLWSRLQVALDKVADLAGPGVDAAERAEKLRQLIGLADDTPRMTGGAS